MKITANNNDLKRYFKEIKSLFPTFGKNEKLFFSEFMNEAEDYAASNDMSGYHEIVSYFGKPNAVVSDYLENTDAEYLMKRIRTTRYIKICVALIIAIAVICGVFRSVMIYRSYIEGQDAYIHREEIVIDKQEDTP